MKNYWFFKIVCSRWISFTGLSKQLNSLIILSFSWGIPNRHKTLKKSCSTHSLWNTTLSWPIVRFAFLYHGRWIGWACSWTFVNGSNRNIECATKHNVTCFVTCQWRFSKGKTFLKFRALPPKLPLKLPPKLMSVLSCLSRKIRALQKKSLHNGWT